MPAPDAVPSVVSPRCKCPCCAELPPYPCLPSTDLDVGRNSASVAGVSVAGITLPVG